MKVLQASVAATALLLAGGVAAASSEPVLEPNTQAFIESLAGSTPIYKLSPSAARKVLDDAQSGSVSLAEATIEERTLPVGPTGQTTIHVVRPVGATGTLPVVVYFHGGAWVLGNFKTHERLVRDLSVGAHAEVVFVDYTPSPEARYPVAIEQDYAVVTYVAGRAGEFGVDPSRLAIVGDSVGGNMVAVVSLLDKERQGPKIIAQVLFYPVTSATMNDASYRTFANGPWLTRAATAWSWKAYLPDVKARKDIHVSPLNATLEQLRGLPPALVITDENDVLRDEGEAYARKLSEAGVKVTAIRYLGTIHDFVMLNALRNTPAAKSAVGQAADFLRAAFSR
jgi:acetyl esterase